MKSRNSKLSAIECQRMADKAYDQAKRESRYGGEHTSLITSCGDEWMRRMEWAQRHGGVFNPEEYEWDKRDP